MSAPRLWAAPLVVTGGPYTLTVGGSIVLNGTDSRPAAPESWITRYDWDINGDGRFGDLSGAEPTLSWSVFPLRPGAHTLRLRVIDSRGAQATATTILTVVATHLGIHDQFRNGAAGTAGPARPIRGPSGQFYSTSEDAIWRINADGGGFMLLHRFSSSDGGVPNRPMLAADGKLYGTCVYGGAKGHGTLWRMNLDGSGFTVLHSFELKVDGFRPGAPPAIGPDGLLYGVCAGANPEYGPWDWGTLWRCNPDGSNFTLLLRLPPSAAMPHCQPLFGRDGRIYLLCTGRELTYGTLCRFERDGSGLTVLHAFNPDTEGYWPVGTPVFGPDGRLYGAASEGWPNTAGTVWRINADGTEFAVLHAFAGTADGSYPIDVTFGSDGRLYGATAYGGVNDSGTLWRISPDGTAFTVLHSMNGPLDGSRPWSAPILTPEGWFYGSAADGGPGNGGTLWRMRPNGTAFGIVHSFSAQRAVSGALSVPVFGSDGRLYGTSPQGGAHGYGAVWRMNSDGRYFEVLRHCLEYGDGPAGEAPLLGNDGRIYVAGAYIWRMGRNGSDFAVVRRMNPEDGELPRAPVFGSDGRLYGVNTVGGAHNDGTIWRMNADGSGFGVLHHFYSTPYEGSSPAESPLFGSDGRLYGATTDGGSADAGTVWQLAPGPGTPTFVSMISMGGSKGLYARGARFGRDGALYGVNLLGGNGGSGTLWRLVVATRRLTTLHQFTLAVDGQRPNVPAVAGDGRIYGVCTQGGAHNLGTLWRSNPDGTDFTVLWHFGSGNEGGSPHGTPTLAANGTVYGTTSTGGPGGFGTVFAWSNHAPAASFTATPNPATRGATVRLDGSASFDVDGDRAVYHWLFGDGSESVSTTSAAASHAYASAGTYQVTLEMTDSFGAKATLTRNVTVR